MSKPVLTLEAKTIFWDDTGPLVEYDGEFLHIADLNPQIETHWRMSRWEMTKFGFNAIFAALLASRLRAVSQP